MEHHLTSKQNIFCWIAQIIAAAILFQTLFYKFSGAEESVYIFTKVGIEPWGRYTTGLAELTASILLLIPSYCWLGAMISMGIMGGAILSHLTLLGVSVKNDGGYLFVLALITLLASLIVLYLRKHQIPFINKYFSSIP